VVPLLAWHRRCCVIVVGWTHECMSTRVHTDITACMHTQVWWGRCGVWYGCGGGQGHQVSEGEGEVGPDSTTHT